MLKALLTLCLAVICASPAYSRMMDMPMEKQRGGPGPMREGCHLERMGDLMGSCLEHADKLGLSEDQLTKIKPIRREMQKQRARFEADLRIAQIEQMEIMEVKDFDLEKATAQFKKIAELKTAHHLQMLKSMKEVRSILTDEQFQKMQRMQMTKEGKKPAQQMRKKQL